MAVLYLLSLLRARQDFGRAVEAGRKAVERDGRNLEGRYELDRAALEAQMGDRETAARCLRRILDEAEYVPPYLAREVKPWVKRAKQGLRKLGY